MSVHRINQHRDAFGIDVRRDAVAEVEDVTKVRAEVIERPRFFLSCARRAMNLNPPEMVRRNTICALPNGVEWRVLRQCNICCPPLEGEQYA